MSYDDWKTRSPDDEYDYYNEFDDEPEPDDCWHEDYEADILTGEATCHRCGHRWVQTHEEIAAEARRQAEYDEAVEQQMWRERWLWWWDAMSGAFSTCRGWLRRLRQPKFADVDDEIPF